MKRRYKLKDWLREHKPDTTCPGGITEQLANNNTVWTPGTMTEGELMNAVQNAIKEIGPAGITNHGNGLHSTGGAVFNETYLSGLHNVISDQWNKQ